MANDASGPQRDDGRRQRSARSREQLVQALFELVRDGEPHPTAQQIAERVGLTSRSVFRLFQDMGQLHEALQRRVMKGAPRPEPVPDGGVEQRLRAFVAYRARMFEYFAPFMRAVEPQRSRRADVEAMQQAGVLALRSELLRWFPELGEHGTLTDALEMATSFEAWDRLRRLQQLDVARARSVMEAAGRATFRALDAEAAPPDDAPS